MNRNIFYVPKSSDLKYMINHAITPVYFRRHPLVLIISVPNTPKTFHRRQDPAKHVKTLEYLAATIEMFVKLSTNENKEKLREEVALDEIVWGAKRCNIDGATDSSKIDSAHSMLRAHYAELARRLFLETEDNDFRSELVFHGHSSAYKDGAKHPCDPAYPESRSRLNLGTGVFSGLGFHILRFLSQIVLGLTRILN